MTDQQEQRAAVQHPPVQGYASEDMYLRRWSLIRPHLAEVEFSLVDWGSDAGWFSLAAAVGFPSATVISVEAGLMTLGEGIALHQTAIEEQGIENNTLVNTLFGPATFEGLSAVPADYQLVLSVFHHMGDGFGQYLSTVEEWDAAFCNLVKAANVTFFEVPNEQSDRETPHRIRDWYAGRDIETVIREGLRRGGVEASVQLLGETEHGSKGTRKMFKIALTAPREAAAPEAIAAVIAAEGEKMRIRPYRRLRLMAYRIKRVLTGRGR